MACILPPYRGLYHGCFPRVRQYVSFTIVDCPFTGRFGFGPQYPTTTPSKHCAQRAVCRQRTPVEHPVDGPGGHQPLARVSPPAATADAVAESQWNLAIPECIRAGSCATTTHWTNSCQRGAGSVMFGERFVGYVVKTMQSCGMRLIQAQESKENTCSIHGFQTRSMCPLLGKVSECCCISVQWTMKPPSSLIAGEWALIEAASSILSSTSPVAYPSARTTSCKHNPLTSFKLAFFANKLTVRLVFVHDPTDSANHVIPIGKQTLKPSHIFYTPCSGIWQSVWIESAPANWITQLDLDANMDGQGTYLFMQLEKKYANSDNQLT